TDRNPDGTPGLYAPSSHVLATYADALEYMEGISRSRCPLAVEEEALDAVLRTLNRRHVKVVGQNLRVGVEMLIRVEVPEDLDLAELGRHLDRQLNRWDDGRHLQSSEQVQTGIANLVEASISSLVNNLTWRLHPSEMVQTSPTSLTSRASVEAEAIMEDV